jgi:predicted helicase
MNIKEYIESVNTRYKAGISREHSYRGDLEALIRELVKGVEITNEPANVTDCGNPDYVITKGKIPVGYIEAKDLGKDLNGKQYKEQFGRYKKALDNLIITDYIWFQFFKEGELVHEIKIAEIEDNKIKPLSENFAEFENLINDFCTYIGQTIKSSKKLAEMMAAKARLLQNILEKALTTDEETDENTSLKGQFETFKNILIHDLDPKGFADIYAQTLAYGMFAARLHDTTLEDFSRYEAAELIPKTNPFLKRLFTYVAGPDIDERIKRTVDNLADVFRATNVDALLHNFGKSTQTQDPIIHFYETFLAEYDPKLRKARGVWYTPEPVVNFIVRAVDDILKSEFDLPQGLADTTKTKIKVPVQGSKKMMEKEVHKVQILDPATGTGTFLAEVVSFIYNKKFKAMQGAWSSYVDEHLIPRLNGFELLMASYSMAHLKLDMLLTDTGYKPTKTQRFNIYLTNSLEEFHPDTGTLFSNWLSTEANEANHIKRDTPIMCVIGNPPYSVSSSNKSDWIENLMQVYKQNLNERNIQPLSDDYIKFIRYGQYYIEKNGEGILAYISNNSFIDGLIHKSMRLELLKTFDKIYILDLHGNSKRKEKAPDGSKDENVFDILPGVSINIFIKRKSDKRSLSEVKKFDLQGLRKYKYEFLTENTLSSINWDIVKEFDPQKSFKKYSPSSLNESNSFKVDELFLVSASGITTERDVLTIQDSPEPFNEIVNDIINLDDSEFRGKYPIGKDGRDWKLNTAKNDILKKDYKLTKIHYRPFDYRYTLYTGRSKGFQSYPRYNVSKHLLQNTNPTLIIGRQGQAMGDGEWNIVFISKYIVDCNIYYRGRGTLFPTYLLNDSEEKKILDEVIQKPNFNESIINKFQSKLKLEFIYENSVKESSFSPLNIIDYIYAILHSPAYRTKNKEFLKIDFPRIPYPKNQETFWKIVELGKQIREIHLLESPKVEEYITSYPIDGDNIITTKIGKNDWKITDEENHLGQIWINEEQYFENIPVIAWEFYIGGYQPAQKWLKDRQGRKLSFEDILHYQKIIVALSETDRLMKEIDKIEID